MAFPVSPTNNQTATVNGIVYLYSSTDNAWTRFSSPPGNLTVTSNLTSSGNLIASNLYVDTLKWANGVSISLAGTYSNVNVEAYLGANLTTYYVYANANAATQATSINTINANLGAYQLYANANIGTLFLGNVSTQANLGAFQTFSNANAAAQAVSINTLNANIGAFYTYANSKIGTNSNSNLVIVSTATSANTTSGALVVAGGVGVAGNIISGGNVAGLYGTFIANLSVGTGAIQQDALNLNNNNLYNVNTIRINDPGTSEGISWEGGSGWAIYESPDNLSNNTGNLQIVLSGTRVFTVDTNQAVNIPSSRPATSTTTGALTVAGGVGIGGNLWVGGNIYASRLIGVETSTISVTDPLLYLTASSPSPYNYDIGFYSHFIGGSGSNYQHTGFSRNYTDNTWTLFSNVFAEPGATIDWTEANIIFDPIKVGTANIANTTISTSTTTGALVVGGGAGIAGALYIANTGDVSANIGTLFLGNASTQANLGAYQTYANANAASQQTDINNINANIGEFYTYANANIGTLYLGNVSTQANLGSYQTYANSALANIISNIGEFYTYANSKIGTNTDSNLVVDSTTAATDFDTGALIVKGGAAVAGSAFVDKLYTTQGLFWAGNGFVIATGGGGGGGGTGIVYNAGTAPSALTANPGDQWYNTSNDTLYEYLYDGTNAYWVDVQSPLFTSGLSTTLTGNLTVTGNLFINRATSTTGNISTTANLTVTRNANIFGNILGGNISITRNATVASNLTVSGYTIVANIIASGNTSTTGNISASGSITSGSSITATGNIAANNLSVTNNISTPNISTGNITITGNISGNLNLTGNVNADNIVGTDVSTGNIIVTSNLAAFGNVLFTGANVNLGTAANLHINGGTTGQFLQTDGAGNVSWQDLPITSIQEFTATGGQTVFTMVGTYTVGTVMVFVNGIQMNSVDFTATDGTTVVLSVPRVAGDTVRVFSSVGASSLSSGLTLSVTNTKNFAVAMSIAMGM